ncbi:MAG: hypothetical protein JW751_05900 [Polyangiaceae bacterium]|nr:hypothetical protein [Polyangiaceae bacterium]
MLDPTLRGIDLSWRRLTLGRMPLAPGIALIFVAFVAWLERQQSGAIAADRALTGATMGVALPLMVVALLHRLAPGERLDQMLLPLSRHGVNRRGAVLGYLGALSVVSGGCGMILAWVAVLVARGIADPMLGSDLATSAWIGALGGISYAWLLGLGACVGARGGGRWTLLLLDAGLGMGTGTLALPWPRAHLRNLLGAEGPLVLAQWTAVPWLLALTSIAMLGVFFRVQR